MSPASEREKALCEGARLLPADKRSDYLDAACGEDSELRARVDSLLKAFEQAEQLPEESPVAAQALPAALPQPVHSPTIKLEFAASEMPGDRIGRYKLLQSIGEGGCGVVYVAEQEEPVRRRVALKVIKLGMDTRQVIGRFEAERQALAMMDHPNIAKVLDAGSTETGRPYFVMELVRGIKITDYCDENHLDARRRLELFIPICQAVQHAHQKGIVHRDLKPSNILVAHYDGVPVAKVIDFGIAKATDGRLTERTVYTELHQFIGTPAYMSPEQAEMSGLDVDTRTDIYSLGVVLYELLTGQVPFDHKELMDAGLDGMRRLIREKEPPRPSTRLSTMEADALTRSAARRNIEAPRLINLVRGDLDWIVMKCLEKDRTRRYQTANGLAMDLQRYLQHEPVVARPPSRLYKLGKMARRNKLAFAAALSIAVTLLLGAVVSAWFAARAKQERDQALHARAQSELINGFLTEDLLYQATPEKNVREKKVTMEEVLAKATRKLDQDPELVRQPEVEATLRLALGSTYLKLSSLSEARRNLLRAVTLRQSALGPKNVDTLAAQNELGRLLVEGTREFDEGEKVTREAFLGREQLLGPESRNTLDSMSLYVEALLSQRKLDEAEKLARKSLELLETTQGTDSYNTIAALNALALILAEEGKYKQAEQDAREELVRFKRTGQEDCDDAIWGVNNLAFFLLLEGDPQEGEEVIREALPRANRIFGEDTLIPLHLQHVLVRILDEEGHPDQAEARARAILPAHLRDMPTHEGTARLLLYLGRVLVEQERQEEARPYLEQALSIFHEHYPMKPELGAQAASWLAAIELAKGNYAQAEKLLMPGSELFLGPVVELTLKERRALVNHAIMLEQNSHQAEKALAWQKKLDDLEKTLADSKR